MKIVKIRGGLGNQMFQYAFGKALERQDKNVCFDLGWFGKKHKDTAARNFDLNCFNVRLKPAYFWQKLFSRTVKETQANIYEPALLEQPGRVIFSGYFQSEDYFKKLRPELLLDFSLKAPLNDDNQKILAEIRRTDSVSLHVRRGDYVNLAHIYGVCGEKYYNRAVEYIKKQVADPHFFLFSDDVTWVRENIKIDASCTVVDVNDGKTACCDMELMRNCRHNIIANSSFSWWSAWLNENKDKIVICPEQWFADGRQTDIICKDWIKISVF